MTESRKSPYCYSVSTWYILAEQILCLEIGHYLSRGRGKGRGGGWGEWLERLWRCHNKIDQIFPQGFMGRQVMFVLYNLLATTDLFPPENPMIPLKSCLSRSCLLLFRQSNWCQLHWGTLSMVFPCQTNIILREKLPGKTKTLQQSCWSYCKMKVIWSLLPSWAIPLF